MSDFASRFLLLAICSL